MNEKIRENSSGIVSVFPGEKAVFVHRTEKGLRDMEIHVYDTLEKVLKAKKTSKKVVAMLKHPELSEGMVRGLVIGTIPGTPHAAVLGSTYGVGEKQGRKYYSLGSIRPLIQPPEREARIKELITTIVRAAYDGGLVFFPDIIAKK